MWQAIGALSLVALGMAVDMMYQRKVRIAALDAYKDGYQAALMDHVMIHDPVRGDIPMKQPKSKAKLPDGFEAHMREHGHATARLQ